ncbi:hypothetical protein [Plantactinospora sp. WMMB782]|uniref:hypothetical protein n=1 Tax=Plantactinospora sp. WMMB782 TaxID=3404121 RepID=UPI003B953DE7
MTALPNIVAVDCWRCGDTPAAGTCCSSHDKLLCHRCYRLTHFVERCTESCRECAAESLPLILTPAIAATIGRKSVAS